MTPISNVYLKTFIRIGAPFAVLMFLTDLVSGDVRSLVKYLFLFVFFGGAMSAMMVSYHVAKVKELLGKSDLSDEDLSAKQTKTIISKINNADLINKLRVCSAPRISSVDHEDNVITFYTGISRYSWGEKLKLTFHHTEDESYFYTLSSEPKLPLTSIDYGKNLENIQLIQKLMG